MQVPFTIFGIDTAGTAVTSGLLQQWPHMTSPAGFMLHLPLVELDRRGMAYTCRMFGDLSLGKLALVHKTALARLDIFLPVPVGDERFVDQDSNVTQFVADRDAMRALHVAVGLSSSSLTLNIAARDGASLTEVGRAISLAELDALGPEAANVGVGEAILRELAAQHRDVFAAYPHLSFQPQDQP